MPKSFGIPTWRKLQAIEDRLTRLAESAATHTFAGANKTQTSLRDLLDEAGFYDRVGGVDVAAAQAQSAAAANTLNQPAVTDFVGVNPATGETKDLGYRDFFPEVDYSRADKPLDVFMSWSPTITQDNSFYSAFARNRPDTPAMVMGRNLAALEQNAPVADATAGMALLAAPGKPATLPQISDNKAQFLSSGLFRALADKKGQEKIQRAADLGERGWQHVVTGVPEHVVLGFQKTTRQPSFGNEFTPVLMHEMTHAGLQPQAVSMLNERRFPDSVLDPLLDDIQAYYEPIGTLSPEELVSMNDDAGFFRKNRFVAGGPLLTPEYADARRQAADVRYRTRPIETDAALAEVKRAYAAQTGRLVNTPEEAEKALRWFRDYNQSGIFDPQTLPFEVNTSPITADYYLNPEQYSPDGALPKQAYLQRMTELFGLGGVGVLAGLMGEGEDEDGRVRY